MKNNWEPLAECLRSEVQEYGGLLHVFEDQQACVFRRDSERLLPLIEAVSEATRTAEAVRRRREMTASAFATERGLPAGATLRQLLPHVEPDARPLLEALIAEVNHLIHRLRRVTRQNQLLLARTVELQQTVLRQFQPEAFTQTYSPRGRVAIAATLPAPAYRAAG